MSPDRSGLILLHLNLRADLGQYLVDRGFQITRCLQSPGPRSVRVIVSDQSPALNAELARILHNDRAGLILLRAEDGTTRFDPLAPDALLPPDVSGRELTTAIDLVSQLVDQRWQLEVERAECRLWVDLAMHDSLTQLPNRRSWDRQMAQRLTSPHELCVAVIDVDLFKQVNDLGGYVVGDRVLCAVASSLRRQLRDCDYVARLGGDEFGVLLSQVGLKQSLTMLNRLRNAVSDDLAALELPAPTLSAGCCVLSPPSVCDIESIVAAAAAALQAAKRQNRNRVVVFDASCREVSVGKLEKKSS